MLISLVEDFKKRQSDYVKYLGSLSAEEKEKVEKVCQERKIFLGEYYRRPLLLKIKVYFLCFLLEVLTYFIVIKLSNTSLEEVEGHRLVGLIGFMFASSFFAWWMSLLYWEREKDREKKEALRERFRDRIYYLRKVEEFFGA